MKQYEYNYVKCGAKDIIADGLAYKYLNSLGKDGWEVCGFAATDGCFVWTLKKEIIPETPYRG